MFHVLTLVAAKTNGTGCERADWSTLRTPRCQKAIPKLANKFRHDRTTPAVKQTKPMMAWTLLPKHCDTLQKTLHQVPRQTISRKPRCLIGQGKHRKSRRVHANQKARYNHPPSVGASAVCSSAPAFAVVILAGIWSLSAELSVDRANYLTVVREAGMQPPRGRGFCAMLNWSASPFLQLGSKPRRSDVPRPHGGRPRVVPSLGLVRGADWRRSTSGTRSSVQCLGSAQRLVLEVLDQRRNFGASREQENRHQRQCVRVAGIPIMNGSNVLEGYVRETIALTTRSTPYSMRKAPAR